MEIYILSFLVITLAILGLAVGTFFGRSEIRSTCSRLGQGNDGQRCEMCNCEKQSSF